MRAKFLGRLRRDEYQIRECPYCGNQKSNCEVNVDKLVFKCWACGVGGSIRGLFMDFDLPVGLLPDTPLGRRMLTAQEMAPVTLPPEARPLYGESEPMMSFAMRYLTGERPMRGMTEEEVQRYGLLYAPGGDYKNRVIWPLYEGPDLVYFVARRFMKNAGRPYDYPEHRRRSITPVYMGTTNKMTLVLVEGVFEVPGIQRLGYSVMPLLGSEINPAQVRKLVRRNFKEYVVFLDRDAVVKSVDIADRLCMERLKATYTFTDGPDSDELDEGELEAVLGARRRPGVSQLVRTRLRRLA